ncbi:MAG: hypothetical protein LCH30_04840, partial [Proteobacteria bacterium]|nr:hypothetical protein [Pseudomonadota bacterium]
EIQQNLHPLIDVCSKASDKLAIVKESQDPEAVKLAISELNSLDIDIRLTSLNIFTICQSLLEKEISQTIIDEIDNVTKLLSNLFSTYKSLLPPPEKRISPLRALRKANNAKKKKEEDGAINEEKETLNLNRRSLIIKKESAESPTDKDGTMEIKTEEVEKDSIVLKIKTLTISYENNFQQAYLLPKDNLIRLAMADVYKKCQDILDETLKERIIKDLSKHWDAIFLAKDKKEKEDALVKLVSYASHSIQPHQPELASAIVGLAIFVILAIAIAAAAIVLNMLFFPTALSLTAIFITSGIGMLGVIGSAAALWSGVSIFNFFQKGEIRNNLSQSVIDLAVHCSLEDNWPNDAINLTS